MSSYEESQMPVNPTEEMEIPETFSERFTRLFPNGFPMISLDDSLNNKNTNLKLADAILWAAPYDARFPQARKERMCFHYYVDYFRCLELMGEEYKPCKFFKNVYKDICPSDWVGKWDELREDNRFPVKLDR